MIEEAVVDSRQPSFDLSPGVSCCERKSIASSLKAKRTYPQNKESEEVQDETVRGWTSKFTPYVRSEKGELSRCHFAIDGKMM